MKSPDALADVEQFHEVFDLPVESAPIIPSEERCRLRINLLEEELKELKAAIERKDLVEIADAFCDLQYVLSGAILEFGFGDTFEKLFREVHRSNMSKVCQTLEEAQQTVEHYKAKGIDAYVQAKENIFVVYRKSDNKVLKSVRYSPAQLRKLIFP